MRVTILPKSTKLTKAPSIGPQSVLWPRVYCGLSTTSEVFLIFTTQLYPSLCNYDTLSTFRQEGSIATGII